MDIIHTNKVKWNNRNEKMMEQGNGQLKKHRENTLKPVRPNSGQTNIELVQCLQASIYIVFYRHCTCVEQIKSYSVCTSKRYVCQPTVLGCQSKVFFLHGVTCIPALFCFDIGLALYHKCNKAEVYGLVVLINFTAAE